MSAFRIVQLPQSAILYLHGMKEEIDLNPEYQRASEVWTGDKRQLLIDSILNGFDVPKIYFHDLNSMPFEHGFAYAVIDGKQRLEAIWSFINDDFPLADDFVVLNDSSVSARGMRYSELAQKYPKLKRKFDSTSLAVLSVETDEIDLIDEMFSRLNEAVPLNAAEKRNALGGPLPSVIRSVVQHEFFTKRVRISNKRYQHRDLAAKFLYVSHEGRIVDTKKSYLDEFVREQKRRGKKPADFRGLVGRVDRILDGMSEVFRDSDALLRSAGMIVAYYLLWQEAIESGWSDVLSREKLDEFHEKKEQNRHVAEQDITKANYELLEFDRLAQSSNDGYAHRIRLETLCGFFGYEVVFFPDRGVRPEIAKKLNASGKGP